MKRTQTSKAKPSFKKWCNYCRRYGHSISECRQKQQDNQNKLKNIKNQIKSFYQYMKKDQKSTEQNSPTATTVQENHSRTIQIIQEINHHITQVIEEDHQNEENTYNSSQNHYNRPNSRNNYSRSNSNTQRFVF